MDVTKEITKEIFEQYVPAAKMPERNTSVFNRMVPYFSRSYQHLQDLLFKDIPTLMDADDLKTPSCSSCASMPSSVPFHRSILC